METKAELRKRIRALMKQNATVKPCDELWHSAEALPDFANAATILIYCSLPDEVPTASFIEKWYGSKRIAIPLVVGDTLLLKEYDPAKVHVGSFGIIEPDDDAPDIDPAEIDLAFIPGVAFDRNGMRLGRGKGFYDRLIPSLRCPLVGICFGFQLLDDPIPADPWDRPMTTVLACR